MNDIAGPATGLDMLLLFAGANPANGGSVAGDDAFVTFEEALGNASIFKSHLKKAAVGNVQLPDPELGPQPTIRRECELTAACTLPLELSYFPTVPQTTELAAKTREVSDAVEVCYAAIEFTEPSPIGEVDTVPVLVDTPHNSSTLPQPLITDAHTDDDASTAEARSNPSSTPDDVDKPPRDAQFDFRVIARDEFANELTDVQLPVKATRFEPVHPVELAIQQPRDAIIQSVKPYALVRVQRTLADAPSQRQTKGTKEFVDKSIQSSTALDSPSFDTASQPLAGEVESPIPPVSAPTLIDELAADWGQFDSKHDEIVVELNIPDWGVLEIEVVRDGDETEVSLIADPAVNQLIRDYLPELTEALSASGIELAGLDVRQHDQEHQAREGHEVFLPMELTEIDRGGSNSETHLANISIRTGLSRYRLMSITA